MSIISLALFQSLGQMLAVSDRALRIGNESLDQFANEAGYRDFIGDIIGTWTHIDPSAFKGNSQEMSGLAVSPLIAEQQTGAQGFRLSIETIRTEAGQPPRFHLILDSEGLAVNAIGRRARPILAMFEGQNPTLLYVSYDQISRSIWPPDAAPSPGIFNDNVYMDIPRLPHAIGLSYEHQGRRVSLWARTRHDLTLTESFDRDVQ
jgi:hypothetical protein